eukprot:105407-Ditylum_brightwellii.AAC.1
MSSQYVIELLLINSKCKMNNAAATIRSMNIIGHLENFHGTLTTQQGKLFYKDKQGREYGANAYWPFLRWYHRYFSEMLLMKLC